MYSRLVDRAMEFSARAHEGQHRKSSPQRTPYASHPASVALYLGRLGCRDEVLAAALLHDVLEDTAAQPQELSDLFGGEVLRMVQALSEPPKGQSWDARKAAWLQQLERASGEVVLVAVADKLHNLSGIAWALDEAARQGQPASSVWAPFKGGPSKTLAMGRALAALARKRSGEEPRLGAAAHALETILAALERHALGA